MSTPLFPRGYNGLADSRWSGAIGTVAESVGIDAHSTPGLIKVHQKLSLESGEVVNELCNARVNCSDGSRLWCSATSGKVWRELAGTYSLLWTIPTIEAADITFAVFGGNEKSEATTINYESMVFNDSGTVMLSWRNGRYVRRYTLSTAWDISTLTFHSEADLNAQVDGSMSSMAVSGDGTKLYAMRSNRVVYQYTMSTAWLVSTLSYDTKTFTLPGDSSRGALTINPDGTRFFYTHTFGTEAGITETFTLSTAFDISTATSINKTNVVALLPSITVSLPLQMQFDPTGEKLFIFFVGGTPYHEIGIYEYALATAYTVSTATYTKRFRTAGPASSEDLYQTGVPKSLETSFYISFSANKLFASHSNFGGSEPKAPTVYEFDLPTISDTPLLILDAAEHNENVFFSTKVHLFRIPIASLTTFSTLQIVGQYKDPTDGPRPMLVHNLNLYIGNGQNISQVNELNAFFQTTQFTVPKPEVITAIDGFDVDLIIGTHIVDRGRILRWDTFSDSWSAEDTVYEPGIKAFVRDDNYLYAIAGEFGRMYFYNGEALELMKRIRGNWTPTSRATIHHNSVGFHNGLPVFGLSTAAGTPCKMGIYTYGGYSRDYPRALDLAFPKGNTYNALSVGAILIDGADLRVSFNDGVYKLDYTAKYEFAHIETRQLTGLEERSEEQTYTEYQADYVSLPSGAGVTFSYRDKYASAFVAMPSMIDTDQEQIRAELSVPDVSSLQLRLDMVVSGNNGPEFENISVL